jgi:hypothetical protein
LPCVGVLLYSSCQGLCEVMAAVGGFRLDG